MGEDSWCTVLTLGKLSSVQLLSRVWLFATPWIAARQASLSITNSWSSLKLMSIESVMPSSHLILCHPLLLLPPVPPSIRVFSSESAFRIRWPKYWSFSFSTSPSNEHPGLISFRMDWLDLLTVQGTLKSLLQHHSSKAWNMYIIICEIDHRSRFDAWDRMLRAGTLGWPCGMGWGGRWEGDSGWGTHVHQWLIHVNVWQKPLQYCNVNSLQLK